VVKAWVIRATGDADMKKSDLSLPEIGFIAVTRGMLGAGAGLLLAGRLDEQRRKNAGRWLLALGVLTTLPLVADVLSKRR